MTFDLYLNFEQTRLESLAIDNFQNLPDEPVLKTIYYESPTYIGDGMEWYKSEQRDMDYIKGVWRRILQE